MKPYVVCHMISSADGRILPRRWTQSPDGTRSDWMAAYGAIHEQLDSGAWIVGRVTMAEMSKAASLSPQDAPSRRARIVSPAKKPRLTQWPWTLQENCISTGPRSTAIRSQSPESLTFGGIAS